MIENFAENAAQFRATTDVKARLQKVTHFRESIEIVHTAEYDNFLKHLFPVFVEALTESEPQFEDNEEQKIRSVLLEILNRLPHNEVLSTYIVDLTDLVMKTLQVDNQENAIICIRVIFDAHKTFSPKLEQFVEPFINVLVDMYTNLEMTMKLQFYQSLEASVPDNLRKGRKPLTTAIDQLRTKEAQLQKTYESKRTEELLQEIRETRATREAYESYATAPSPHFIEEGTKPISKATQSFKVLTECPLIVMLLFQLHPKYVETYIPKLIPLMLKAVALKAPAQASTMQRQLFADFISSQVKTLSFLTYVLRGFAEKMKPHQDDLAKCVVRLLWSCPPDAVSARKSLLNATRHILATDFRKGFFPLVDRMLDETVWIGQGRSSQQVLRPLAASTLADLVHHVREELNIDQLSRVIYIFAKNVHDPTLPFHIQTASVRLILSLTDCIFKNANSDGRNRMLLIRILSCLAGKFDSLERYIPGLLEAYEEKQKKDAAKAKEKEEQPDAKLVECSARDDEEWSLNYTASVLAKTPTPEQTIRDVRNLLFAMIFGLKTVAWCICNHRRTPDQPLQGLDEEDCAIVSQFLKSGLKCFKLYGFSLPPATKSSSSSSLDVGGLDVLEHFASVFTVLDHKSFRLVFSVEIEVLVEAIVSNTKMQMLVVPQLFLANANVSKCFADIMLSYLITRMGDMAHDGTSEKGVTSIALLNLFRLVFGSVTIFQENETVLRPYISTIVRDAMRFAQTVKTPYHFFSLLRALFRSIGGGKFELLYKEFLPLLPELLEGLMTLQQRGPDDVRDICVELCLTVPARLSSLLAFIPLLMKIVLQALNTSDENVVKLGLRTLEFWVDNLNPEYLYPHMECVLEKLMRSLCRLLKTPPSFGMTALSVLGKVGGYNRRFFIEEFDFKYEDKIENGLMLDLKFPDHPFEMPLDRLVDDALMLLAGSGQHRRKQAFLLLKTCIIRLMDVEEPPKEYQSAKEFRVVEDDESAKGGALTSYEVSFLSEWHWNWKEEVYLTPLEVAVHNGMHTALATLKNEEFSQNDLTGVISQVKKFAKQVDEHVDTKMQDETEEAEETKTEKKDEKAEVAVGSSFYMSRLMAKETQRHMKKKSHVTLSLDIPHEDETARLKELAKRLDDCIEKLTAANARLKKMAKNKKTQVQFDIVPLAKNTPPAPEDTAVSQEEFNDEVTDPSTLRVTGTRAAEREMFLKVLRGLIEGVASTTISSDPDIKATNFLHDVVRHFALLCVGKKENEFVDIASDSKKKSTKIDPLLMIDALVTALKSEEQYVSVVAHDCLKLLLDTIKLIVGADHFVNSPVIQYTMDLLSHCCYTHKPEESGAGCRGILLLCERLSPDWICANRMRLIRALVFTFRDDISEYAMIHQFKARAMLRMIIRVSCRVHSETSVPSSNIPAEDMAVASKLLDAKGKKGKGNATKEEKKAIADLTPSSSLLGQSSQPRQANILFTLVSLFAPELISGTSSVRELAHELIELISSQSQKTASALLQPYGQRLMGPIYMQSLHAVPILTRIGYISCVSYGLSLAPTPLIELKDVQYLLEVAIKELASSDEQTQHHGNVGLRSKRSKLTTKLRVESIKLLSSALASAEVRAKPDDYKDVKDKIIRVFFKSLLSPNTEIVEVAKKGLRDVINSEKLPKELLQQCLRPILLKLADMSQLTVPLVEGLAKLLELLSNCFNHTLGEKLLEHLEIFAKADKSAVEARAAAASADSQSATGKTVTSTGINSNPQQVTQRVMDEVKIAASIINLFHLLPNKPESFLERLIRVTLDLEQVLPQLKSIGYVHSAGSASPYREPLIRYLNRNARDSISFFIKWLTHRNFSQLFLAVLRNPIAQPIRDLFMNFHESIIKVTYGYEADHQPLQGVQADMMVDELQVQGTLIIHAMAQFDPMWLKQHPTLVQSLLEVWQSPRLAKRSKNEADERKSLSHVYERKYMIECLIMACKVDPDNSATILWEMLNVFLQRSIVDYTFLAKFYCEEVAGKYTLQQKRKVMLSFLKFFFEPHKDELVKVFALRLIVIPMLDVGLKEQNVMMNEVNKGSVAANTLSAEGHEDEMVLDNEILQRVTREVMVSDNAKSYGEELIVELLRLSMLLIERMGEQLSFRKDLIKFAWNHLKSDSNSAKHWAYVNVCRFVAAYETPAKIVLQVYVALLRTYQPENRVLVRKALGILMPALPVRLVKGQHKYPTWIKWTKKIIVEEGHLVAELVHIWNLIIRHADLFYSSGPHFVPQMVNSLNRLGLPPARPLEDRKLALDLAALIIDWDKRTLREMAQDNQAATPNPADGPATKKLKLDPSATQLKPVTARHLSTPMAPVETPGGVVDVDMTANETKQQNSEPVEEPRGEKITRPNAVMIELIITFLVRLGLQTCEEMETKSLSQRCFVLLEEGMKIWKGTDIKFAYIDKILASPRLPDGVVLLYKTMGVLNILLKNQSNSFILSNIISLKMIMVKCWKVPAARVNIRDKLYLFLEHIVSRFPTDKDANYPDLVDFHKTIREYITTGLAKPTAEGAHCQIGMLNVITKFIPSYVDQTLLTLLIKNTQRMAREHVTPREVPPQPQVPQGDKNAAKTAQAEEQARLAREEEKMELLSKTIVTCLQLILTHVSAVGEQNKRAFFNILVFLIEKSTDLKVLTCISEIVIKWISGEDTKFGPVLLNKDKVWFLNKMVRFERLNNMEIYTSYLNIILSIFRAPDEKLNNPANSSQEWLPKLQKCFMIGLRCHDKKLRDQFIEIFHNNVQRTLPMRMTCLLTTDWNALSDSFWLTQAVDLLIGILDGNQGLLCPEGRSAVPALLLKPSSSMDTSSEVKELPAKRKRGQSAPEPETKEDKEETKESDEPKTRGGVLVGHSRFLRMMNDATVSSMVEPLRALTHTSADVAHSVFLLLFPLAWSKLSQTDRQLLVKPLYNLMSKDYHAKQRKIPNMARSLLQAVCQCKPMPEIQPQLLKYLAQTHNAWYSVISLLEARVMQAPVDFKSSGRAMHSRIDVLDTQRELMNLYKALNEQDSVYGLWQRRIVSPYSRSALAYQTYGDWNRAQDTFYLACMNKLGRNNPTDYKHVNAAQQAEKERSLSYDGASTSGVGMSAGRSETLMWQEQWVESARHLNQWDVLSEFAYKNNNPKMELDCSWRLSNWTKLRDLVHKYRTEDLTQLFCSTFLAFHDSNHGDPEKLADKGIQMALHAWTFLPKYVSSAHLTLLTDFQRLVELQECSRKLKEIQQAKRSNQVPHFKNFVTTWRERLPNTWEEIPVWGDVLTWRTHMFRLITQAFPYDLQGHVYFPAKLHDEPWTVLKFAQLARKQNLGDVCLNALGQLYKFPSLDAVDAFHKLREQIQTCLLTQEPTDLKVAVHLIGTTNLEYFSPEQKSEMFRLRGEALQYLGLGDEANTSFSWALTVCDTYGKGWHSWGLFCDRVFSIKRDVNWADHAIVCYLQAIAHKSEKSRHMIPRILWLLSFDAKDPNTSTLNRTFARFMDAIKPWVWIVWIPQLLSSLARSEGASAKHILSNIAKLYPQSLYYTVRAFLLEKRDQQRDQAAALKRSASSQQTATEHKHFSDGNTPATPNTMSTVNTPTDTKANAKSTGIEATAAPAKGQTPASVATTATTAAAVIAAAGGNGAPASATAATKPAPVAATSMEMVEDVIRKLRNTHPSLLTEMERMVDQFGKFKPTPEEELLGPMYQMVLKCFKSTPDDTIPEPLSQALEKILNRFFHVDASNGNQRHIAFVHKYKALFMRDFGKGENAAKDLTALLHRLRHWKTHLMHLTDQPKMTTLEMEKCSPYLIRYESTAIEVPGQYLKDDEPVLTEHVILQRFEADVHVDHGHGYAFRRLGMRGDNGKVYYFLVQYLISHVTRSDERMSQFFGLFNNLMASHKESRKRNLAYTVPVLVPLNNRLRLLSTTASQVSLEDVYETSCNAHGIDPDRALFLHRELISQIDPSQLNRELKLSVYDKICQEAVPDYLFKQYMHKTIRSADELWAFKKVFTAQMALTGYLCYLMNIGDRYLCKIRFSKNSGRVTHYDCFVQYNSHFLIEFHDPVPFRLTRNLTSFMTPFMVDGLFTTAVHSANMCLIKHQEVIKNYMYIFIRDDLISWHVTKTQAMTDAEQKQMENRLRPQIQTNVEAIMNRSGVLRTRTPSSSSGKQQWEPIAVDSQVRKLISLATDKKDLSLMHPSWLPWF